jgi:REase_MTES_1575
MAAVLACGPGAVLSHYSACWLLDLAHWSPEPFHVTGPVARRPRLPVRIHRSRRLLDVDRNTAEEIPVTALPRTLLDMAATNPRYLPRMVERAEDLGLFDLGPVEELLGRTRGHHGWGRLRKAIAMYRPVPFTRSGFERRFLEALQGAGLPPPRANYVVAGFELDLYWPEHRFAIELDAYRTHGSRAAFERDRLRHEDLKLAGIELTRVTDVRFHREPEAVLDRVAALLAQRASAPAPYRAASPP